MTRMVWDVIAGFAAVVTLSLLAAIAVSAFVVISATFAKVRRLARRPGRAAARDDDDAEPELDEVWAEDFG